MYQECVKIHFLPPSGCGNLEVAEMLTSHLSCSALVNRCSMRYCFLQKNSISIPNLHHNSEVLCTVDCCPVTLEHNKNMEHNKTKESSPEGQTLSEFIYSAATTTHFPWKMCAVRGKMQRGADQTAACIATPKKM